MADIFAQLWPASYKGVAFWTEKTDESGGRRLGKYSFPYSNSWFIENLGQKIKDYSVTAYVVDDDYIADASALGAACDGDGAGPLVLPAQGPVQCHCEDFKRAQEKDRTGYIAFDCKFVLDGQSSPIVSVDYSAQLALDAAAGAADASGPAGDLAAQVSVAGAPAWVVAAAVASLQDAVATLDTIRTTANVDATQSQVIEGQLTALYNAVPAAVSNVSGIDAAAIVPPLVAAALALAAAMDPATAADAFGTAADDLAQPPDASPSATLNATTAAANAAVITRLTRYAMMAAYLTGVVNATYASRPEGVNAKVLLIYRFDRELELCFGAPDERLYIGLQALRSAGVAYIETLITTLAPVLTIQAKIALPSLVWAWTIYQDPTRSRELVLRNEVKHPSYMPLVFEALAPTATA